MSDGREIVKHVTERVRMRDSITIERYSTDLFNLITSYREDKVDECISQGHYLEAIGSVFIQISEQLRFLLVKRIKGHENIPLDLENYRYKSVLKLIKEMNDYQLNQLAFILGRIDKREFDHLNRLRKLRNDFSHSFEKRKKYSEDEIKKIINNSRKVERKLRGLVEMNQPDSITMQRLNL